MKWFRSDVEPRPVLTPPCRRRLASQHRRSECGLFEYACLRVLFCLRLSLTTAHARPRAPVLAPECNVSMACDAPRRQRCAFDASDSRHARRARRATMREAFAYAPPTAPVEREDVPRRGRISMSGIVPALAAKVAQIQSACPGAHVISAAPAHPHSWQRPHEPACHRRGRGHARQSRPASMRNCATGPAAIRPTTAASSTFIFRSPPTAAKPDCASRMAVARATGIAVLPNGNIQLLECVDRRLVPESSGAARRSSGMSNAVQQGMQTVKVVKPGVHFKVNWN